jgi:hypothetical protein
VSPRFIGDTVILKDGTESDLWKHGATLGVSGGVSRRRFIGTAASMPFYWEAELHELISPPADSGEAFAGTGRGGSAKARGRFKGRFNRPRVKSRIRICLRRDATASLAPEAGERQGAGWHQRL